MDHNNPPSRWGHSAVSLNGMLYMWSGCTADTPKVCTSNSPQKQKLLKKMYILNISDTTWLENETEGVPPPSIRGSASTTNGRHVIYNFGGYCGHDYHWYNDLHQLQILAGSSYMEWHRVESTSSDVPKCKQDCGMVYFTSRSNGKILCVFGGAIMSSNRKLSVYDELHVLNINDRSWYRPNIGGSQPPPCSGFSFTAIDAGRAILFGGRGSHDDLLSHLYILNAENWMWEKAPNLIGIPAALPQPRESHCAVFIDNSLIIIGGLGDKNESIIDSWSLNLKSFTWSKFTLPMEAIQRISGSATCQLLDGLYHIVTYGGLISFVPKKPHTDMNPLTVICLIDGESNRMIYWYDTSLMGKQIKDLSKENQKLKEENEKLKKTLKQMPFDKQYSEPAQPSFDWISEVDDSLLVMKDLHNVLQSLDELPNWRELGLSLGLHNTTLDEINIKKRGEVKECKIETLSKWFMGCDSVRLKDLQPSWRALVKSINDIGYHAIARYIASNHRSKIERTTSFS